MLCTTKLAQSTYYKACTKHVPVLLCTTKLAQRRLQYYFVLQSLHKVRPSTTWYYKFQQLKMWKPSFRARLPSDSNSWRCENEAFLRGLLQIPIVEDLKTKLRNRMDLDAKAKNANFEALLKRNFQRKITMAKTWRCENKAFVQGLLQI